ncbi:MAG: hypothetical protein ABI680_14420, partial [Chthoniobacteraceae bacterium]
MRISFGHRAKEASARQASFIAGSPGMVVEKTAGVGLESGETINAFSAGAGDVDSVRGEKVGVVGFCL